MTKSNKVLVVVFALGISIGLYLASSDVSVVSSAVAQSNQDKPLISPTEARERDFYAPNSETLAPDEMRVIACGTGMPTPRPAQAAACILVELGNGDKFLFDIGDGSVERLFGLQIPKGLIPNITFGLIFFISLFTNFINLFTLFLLQLFLLLTNGDFLDCFQDLSSGKSSPSL